MNLLDLLLRATAAQNTRLEGKEEFNPVRKQKDIVSLQSKWIVRVLQMSAIVLAVILRCGSNVRRVYVIGSPRHFILESAEKRIDLLTRRRLVANKASKNILMQLLSRYSALNLLSDYTI